MSASPNLCAECGHVIQDAAEAVVMHGFTDDLSAAYHAQCTAKREKRIVRVRGKKLQRRADMEPPTATKAVNCYDDTLPEAEDQDEQGKGRSVHCRRCLTQVVYVRRGAGWVPLENGQPHGCVA
jgi:hypothetical protein